MVDPFATQAVDPNATTAEQKAAESNRGVGFDPADVFGGSPDVFAAMQPTAFQPIDPETGQPIDHTQETLDPFLRDSVDEQQSLEEDVAMATVGDVYEDAAQIPQEDPAQIPEEDSMDIHAVQDADVVSDVSPELTIEAPVDETPITSEEVVSDVMDSSYGDGMIENVQTSDEGIGEQEQYNPTKQSIDSSVADAVVDPIVEQDASTEYSEDPFVAGDVVSQDADYYDPFLADHADARFAVSSDGEDPFVSASVDEAIVPESEESSDVIDSIPDDAVDAIGEASDPSLDEPQVSSDDLPSSVDLDPVDDSLSEPENITEVTDATDDQDFEDAQEHVVDPFLRDDMDVEQTVVSEPSILTAAEEFSAQGVVSDEIVSDIPMQSDVLESPAEFEPLSQESIDELPSVDVQDAVPELNDTISPIGDTSIDENVDADLEEMQNIQENTDAPAGGLQGLVDGFIDPFIASSSNVESASDSVEDVDQDISDEEVEEVPVSSDVIGEFEDVPASSLVASDDLEENVQEANDGDALEPTVDEVVDDNTKVGNYSDLVQKFYALQQAIYHVYDYQDRDEDFSVVGADNDALSITYTFALSHDQQHIIVTKQQINRSDDSQTSHVLRFVLTKDITLEVFIDDVLLFTEAGLADDIKGKMQVMDKFNKFIFLVNTYADSLADQARLVQDAQQAKEHFQQF